MKKAFAILTVVCIISFIAFGVSVMFLGRPHSANSSPIDNGGKGVIFEELVSGNDSWEVVNQFPNISVYSAGAKTILQQTDSDRIEISANVPDGRELYASAVCYEGNGQLIIEVRPENITFSDIAEGFGKLLWSDDVFDFLDGITVTISFPKIIYSSLDIKLGSGEMYVDEIFANYNNIEIGSGTFNMQRSESFTSDCFNVDLGSGKAVINSMRSDCYEIEVGSGSFVFAGISGSGTFEMGTGKGSLALADNSKSMDIDMGTGTLDLYIPKSGVKLDCEMGAGTVKVDAYGVETTLKNNSEISELLICDGDFAQITSEVSIDIGTGKINVLEAADLQIEKAVLSAVKDEAKYAASSALDALISAVKDAAEHSASSTPDAMEPVESVGA